MKFLAYLLLLITSYCSAQLKSGTWRGVLLLDSKNNIELPFNFEIKQHNTPKICVLRTNRRMTHTQNERID